MTHADYHPCSEGCGQRVQEAPHVAAVLGLGDGRVLLVLAVRAGVQVMQAGGSAFA